MFELDQHLKQSGLANKEHVPWDGGIANPAAAPVLDVIRRLVHDIHVITHEAHKLEGMGFLRHYAAQAAYNTCQWCLP